MSMLIKQEHRGTALYRVEYIPAYLLFLYPVCYFHFRIDPNILLS